MSGQSAPPYGPVSTRRPSEPGGSGRLFLGRPLVLPPPLLPPAGPARCQPWHNGKDQHLQNERRHEPQQIPGGRDCAETDSHRLPPEWSAVQVSRLLRCSSLISQASTMLSYE